MENKEKKEPNFIDQAFAIIEESYSQEEIKKQHGMTIADHKLLCKILNTHETYIDESIIQKFINEIAEHYKPIMEGINGIAKDVKDIKEWQIKTEERLGNEESKSAEFDHKIKDFDHKIKSLENHINNLNPELVEDFISVMNKMIATQNFWNIAKRIAIAVVISIVTSIMLFSFLHKYM